MTETPRKVALITGSSRGLGRAMALKLAQDGFDVAVHYGRNADEARKVAAEARAAGVRAEVFGADLAGDPALVASLARALEALRVRGSIGALAAAGMPGALSSAP